MRLGQTLSSGRRWGLSLLGFLAVLLPGRSAVAASAYPWPQNRTYAFGVKPNFATGSWANDNANIMTKWNAWKAANVTAAGAGGFLRVQRPSNSNDTVSEGISYGMILAVYFDDQATFNGLWQYKQIHNDGLGLMNWNINSGGGVQGGNSAADADTDIAYALYLAHYQWGSGGPFNYKNLADAEVLKLKQYDLDASNRLKPGDSFSSCQYPSYFFPNEYKVFANQTNDSFTWNQVATSCYNAIGSSRDNGTGLVAEECQMGGGLGGGCGVSSSQYQYNSCRVPFRMTLDYVYYGTANANTELTKLRGFFGGIGPTSVADCYNLNGSACGGFNNAAFEGPAACSFMSGGASLQTYYAQLMAYNDNSYYSGALQLLSLLLLSGNMPNIADPGSIYTPTVTPSPTNYAGSPTFTATQTPIAFGYIFEDFEVGALAGAYGYNGTGGSAISYTDSTLDKNSGTYSLKLGITVTAGQYAGMGFSSNYANGLGVVDATGSNAIRFAIKSSSNVTFTLQIREAGSTTTAVAGGDGELWDSPSITVFAGPSWNTQTISLVSPAWTEDLYSSNGAAGNNVMNLSAAKVIQLNFSTVVAGAVVYIDDIAFVPSVAPSPTSTKTPFNNPYSQLYDDMESPMSLSVPARAGTYADAANLASASWSVDSTTVASGAKSAKLTYNTGNAASYGCGGFDISPYGTPSLYVDATGAVTLGFWINAPAGLKYKMEFQEAGSTTTAVAGADGEAWLSPLLTAAGGWQWVQQDIASFTEDPYNTVCNPGGVAAPGPCLSGAKPGNGIQDVQAISSVTVKLNGNQGSGALYLDDLTFITTFKTSTPSVSPSPSVSPTRTPSASPSPTPSPSASPSVTPSASSTSTVTTGTSFTSTSTGTPSFTPSPTRTATASPSASSSSTASASPSSTRTATPVLSATSSSTATPTNTFGVPSLTNTPTISTTYSVTPLMTFTSTLTASPTGSRTGTPSDTASVTPVVSFTDTSSTTPSNTPGVPSLTDTPSVTAIVPAATATSTCSVTSTIPTATATASETPLIPTASPTSSVTPMISDLAFTWTPKYLTVTAGTNVTWGWVGTHDVIDDGGLFSSGGPVTAGNFNFTYSTPGTYPYHCGVHGAVGGVGMSGVVYVLGAPATPTPSVSSTPTGTLTASPTSTSTLTNTQVSAPTFTYTNTPVTGPLPVPPVIDSVSPGNVPLSGGIQVTVTGHGFLQNGNPAVLMIDGSPVTVISQTDTQVVFLAPAHVVGTNPAAGTAQLELSYAGAPSNKLPLPYVDPSGPLEVKQVVAVPNPGPSAIAVYVAGPSDAVDIKLYSRSMALIDSASGPGGATLGWVSVPLPSSWQKDLSIGTYYVVVTARQGKRLSARKTGKFFLIR